MALVTGPGLTTREAEVSTLHAFHDGARVLAADSATVAAAVGALDGAALGHVAAHGHFRADAPLFSSLVLADGPLTVHDLHGLHEPPRSLVLSACDSGGAAPIGSYEALGLVSSLLGMGTSDVMASVVPVNDVATLAVMTEVHRAAAEGGTLARGLARRPPCRRRRPPPRGNRRLVHDVGRLSPAGMPPGRPRGIPSGVSACQRHPTGGSADLEPPGRQRLPTLAPEHEPHEADGQPSHGEAALDQLGRGRRVGGLDDDGEPLEP